MGFCCNIILKCGSVCCGCLPLRCAAFIACLCMFISSLIETIGDFYLIKPMMHDKKVTHIELFLYIAGNLCQFCLVTVELVMAFAVWKQIAQAISVTSILYIIFKAIKLVLGFIEAYIKNHAILFLLTSGAAAFIFFVPILWSYQKQIKKDVAEAEAVIEELVEGEFGEGKGAEKPKNEVKGAEKEIK